MSENLYRVAVTEGTKYPQRTYELVVAEDGHSALDKVKEDDSAGELYDEEIQRAILNGEISESQVERKYDGYINEVDYIGSGRL